MGNPRALSSDFATQRRFCQVSSTDAHDSVLQLFVYPVLPYFMCDRLSVQTSMWRRSSHVLMFECDAIVRRTSHHALEQNAIHDSVVNTVRRAGRRAISAVVGLEYRTEVQFEHRGVPVVAELRNAAVSKHQK